MKTPRRCAVIHEEYLMNSIGICWPNIKNRDVRFQMNLLAELLQEQINKKLGKKIKKEEKKSENQLENDDVRKFIAVFRDRYVNETDIEYKSQISPAEIGMIKSHTKKLSDKNVSIEEYMDWIFDVFFEDKYNKEKFVPGIKLVTGAFLASKFFMVNRDKIRGRAVSVQTKSKRETIRNHGKILYRSTNDRQIQKWLEWEAEKTITTEDLEDYMKKYEREKGVSVDE